MRLRYPVATIRLVCSPGSSCCAARRACWMRPGGAPLPLLVCPLLGLLCCGCAAVPVAGALAAPASLSVSEFRQLPLGAQRAQRAARLHADRLSLELYTAEQLSYSRVRPAAGSLMLRHRRPPIQIIPPNASVTRAPNVGISAECAPSS